MRLRRHIQRVGPFTGALPRREDRDHGGAGRRILDDTATTRIGAEPGGQVEQLHQPVDDQRLQLRTRRAGRPQHPLHAQTGRQQVTEHGGPAGVGREIAEETRMLPMGRAGQDDAVEIGEHGVERFPPSPVGASATPPAPRRATPSTAPDATRPWPDSRRSNRRPACRKPGTAPASCAPPPHEA